MNTDEHKDIKWLNSFLRGERAAVETYTQCVEKMDDPAIIGQLRKLRASHQRRVKLISNKVAELGGKPAESSSFWGSFAKLVEGGAKLLGKSAAISTLETGELHGKSDYARDLGQLSPSTRLFIQSTVLPEQLRTHNALKSLQNRM